LHPTPKRVLCVDGDEDTCELLTRLLAAEGYETMTAGRLAEALALVSGGRFDLVIVERTFPDGEGLELCRLLRARDPSTPVLIYSSHPYEPTRDEALSAGARELLFNDGKIEKLAEAVRRLTSAGAT
jgi:DNA-binding response OmpR family regulator